MDYDVCRQHCDSRKQVEESLERSKYALEGRGMKVSRSEREYMCVNEKETDGAVCYKEQRE